MNSPSRPTRESTTRSSVWPQNGHFTGRTPLSGAPLRVEREAVRQLLDMVADRGFHRRRRGLRQHTVDQARDLDHLRLAHPARGDGGRAEADAAGDHRALRLERVRLLVLRDPRAVEAFLARLAGAPA